jgi:pimeloyl-ACP methyl ester carboxylesterase
MMIRLMLCAATLALALAAPLAPTAAQSTEAAAPAMQMEHISVVSIGKGDPVILIPGLASPRAVWDGIAPELAKSHRVLLVQINGFGGDDPRANAKPGIIDGIVADLNGLIVREKLGKPAIMGHSLGGLTALKFALAHPDRVDRLMVVDALPFFGTLLSPSATVAMVEPQAAAMRDRIKATPKGQGAGAPNMSITPEGQAQVAKWSAAANQGVVAQALYEDFITDLRPEMARIKTPVTLLYPSSDAVPHARAEPLYRTAYAGVPQAKLVEVPGSYHFIMLDQPERFAKEVQTFLSR